MKDIPYTFKPAMKGIGLAEAADQDGGHTLTIRFRAGEKGWASARKFARWLEIMIKCNVTVFVGKDVVVMSLEEANRAAEQEGEGGRQ
jgi:hypothetical protein